MDDNSWAWDLPTGSLLHAGLLVGFLPAAVDVKPLVVRVILDRDTGTLSIDHGDGQGHLVFSGKRHHVVMGHLIVVAMIT